MSHDKQDRAVSSVRAFEWDDNKRRSNIEKHGIDFVDATDAFRDAAAYVYASRMPTNEPRFIRVGLAKGVLMSVVFTQRGTVTRVISARVASRKERSIYG